MTNDEIIKEEIDSILVDIIKAYEASGRVATGQFKNGLEAVYEHNKGTVRGYIYLAGRGKSKKPHIEGEKYLSEHILDWINARGIVPRKQKMSKKSLAFAIAEKIHKEGTARSKWLKIYEDVITGERIEKIINRISLLNTNKLITEINSSLEILVKNV